MRLLTCAAAALLATVLAACGEPDLGDDVKALRTPSVAARDATLVLGSVGDDAVEEAEEFEPFAEALAKRLGAAGVRRGKVVVAPSMAEMTRLMRSGKVDLFLDSPYPALSVAKGAGGAPMPSRWKDGLSTYRSAVFVRADSPIETTGDLRGARLGFDDNFSTSGFCLPMATLAGAGLSLAELPAADRPVPRGKVGYLFTGDDENTLFWVMEGRAEAGAMSEEELRELTGDRFDDVRIVASSSAVPRQVVVRAGHLRPELVAALESALTTMNRDAAGRGAMAEFEGTTRFERLDARTRAKLRRLATTIRTAPLAE